MIASIFSLSHFLWLMLILFSIGLFRDIRRVLRFTTVPTLSQTAWRMTAVIWIIHLQLTRL